MIISMHTPKAGGTSFKELLENHYKSKFVGDYKDFPINKTIEQRHVEVKKSNRQFQFYKKFYYDFKNIQCIHGHFLPYKYKSLVDKDNHKFVTWFRDPLERLASHYYYWYRSYNKNRSAPLHKKIVLEKWSFEKFAFSIEMRNFYHQFLWRFPVENFDFIGITEFFDEDVQFFSKYFLNEENCIIPKKNQNPESSKSYYKNYEFYDELKEFHSLDYELYNYALKKRNNRYD